MNASPFAYFMSSKILLHIGMPPKCNEEKYAEEGLQHAGEHEGTGCANIHAKNALLSLVLLCCACGVYYLF